MARIDYYQIEEDIATQLRADANLTGVTVDVEQEPAFAEDKGVFIYLVGREAPAELQTMSAGKRTRFYIHIVLVCMAQALELKAAMEARDDLMSNVELALMSNRTFGNAQVQKFWIEGGNFENSRDGNDGLFNSTGEVEIVVDATSIAT
jgi:hypothetical protein